MIQDAMMKIEAQALHSAMVRALLAHGVTPEHAHMLSDGLLETSLDGIDTHGVRLFATYLKELRAGGSKCAPQMQVQSSLPALAVLDADSALGAVAGTTAMQMAIERARQCGIALVVVKNSNHFGAAGYYAQMAARAGLLGMVMSNSDALVVPFGGVQPLNGTNPLAFAAPGEHGELFSLDMATSQVAFSRVKHFLSQGWDLSSGWATDAQGKDASLTPGAAVHALQPVGGYKGQGLGMMVQICTALLASMPFDKDLSHLHDDFDGVPRQISQTFIAIDIEGLCPLAQFQQRLSELLEIFRSSAAAGDEAVLVPGEKERATRKMRLAEGIPLSADEQSVLAPYL